MMVNLKIKKEMYERASLTTTGRSASKNKRRSKIYEKENLRTKGQVENADSTFSKHARFAELIGTTERTTI